MCRLSAAMLLATLLILSSFAAPVDSEQITQEELVRRTQELYDATALGDQGPWKKYFASDALYFDEKGRSMDKAALVADITPPAERVFRHN